MCDALMQAELHSEDMAKHDYMREAYGNLGDDYADTHDDPAAPVETITFKVSKEWILAGKAIFTVSNDKGEHYTYKVTMKAGEGKRPPVWFVALLTGPNNDADYTYLGCLRPATGSVDLTRASRMNDTAMPVRVIRWAMRVVWAGQDVPVGYGIDGQGRCGRCGIKLTHPDGVKNDGYRLGFGPTCWAKMRG